MRSPYIAACLPLLLASVAHAQTSHLPDTLKKLDATSAQFKSAQADFHKTLTQNFLGEKTETVQDGTMYVDGKGSSVEFALKTVGNASAAPATVDYKKGSLRLLNTKLGCYNTVSTKSGQAESFLAIGFGGSGEDLQREWTVTDLGSETLSSEGKPVAVEKLGLVPKSSTVKSNFTNVTLWIDLSRGIALKQFLVAPSGDTTTAVYSHIRLNQSINKKPYEISGPACK